MFIGDHYPVVKIKWSRLKVHLNFDFLFACSSQIFLPNEFAEKLGESVGAQIDDETGIVKMKTKHWVKLGERLLL